VSFLESDNNIPAEIWFQAIEPLLQEGYKFKICPAGRSMVTFLRGGKDEAVLSIPESGYVYTKNDIVLYKLGNGLYVLHRIYSIRKDGIYTLGDGNRGIEGPFHSDEFLAVVDYIVRKGKVLKKEDRKYILLVNIWRMIRPFRPLVMKFYSALRLWEYKLKSRFTRK